MSFRAPSRPAPPMMNRTGLAAALVAVLSLAACDGVLEPGERAQEQVLFKRYADASRKNSPHDSLDIYRVNADGTGVLNLTGHLAQYKSVSVSPDGRGVVFDSDRGSSGTFHVWMMGTDGSGLTQLTTDYSLGPQWSPDGTRIAFMMLGTDGMHVYVMNADGGTPAKVSKPAMQVGNSCSANSGTPTRISLVGWIPDGRVAFTRYYCGFGYRYFLVNADGSGFTQTDMALNNVYWSPDGSKVVYLRGEGGYLRVMLANADGSGARVLSTQGKHQGLPQTGYSPWSPDGRQIVFYANTAEQTFTPTGCSASAPAYVVNVDGSGVRPLMDPCRGFFNGWSSAGDKVAFTIFPGTAGFPESVPDLYTVNADGTGAVNVTNSPFWESDPLWLPRR